MVSKFLDISTAHITVADRSWLEIYADQKHFIEGVGYPYRYDCGFFISLGEVDNEDGININFSNLFKDVVDHARANECTLIRLDGDSPMIETLQTSDW